MSANEIACGSIKHDHAPKRSFDVSQSASLAVDGEVKRCEINSAPQAPLHCGGETPADRPEFFTLSQLIYRLNQRNILLLFDDMELGQGMQRLPIVFPRNYQQMRIKHYLL